MIIKMELTQQILNWFDDLPKDLQELLASTCFYYIPTEFSKNKVYERIDLFREFIELPNLHLFAYVGHVFYLKSLIEYFFDNKKTKEDWEIYGNSLLDELAKYDTENYKNLVKEKISPEHLDGINKSINLRKEGIKRIFKNFDKDSTTYIYSYELWKKLCDNELSSKSIRKWQDDSFNGALFNK
jgi:hypothetical protein